MQKKVYWVWAILAVCVLAFGAGRAWAGSDDPCGECEGCGEGEEMFSELIYDDDMNGDGDTLDCCCVDGITYEYISTCVDKSPFTPTPTATPTPTETQTPTPTPTPTITPTPTPPPNCIDLYPVADGEIGGDEFVWWASNEEKEYWECVGDKTYTEYVTHIPSGGDEVQFVVCKTSPNFKGWCVPEYTYYTTKSTEFELNPESSFEWKWADIASFEFGIADVYNGMPEPEPPSTDKQLRFKFEIPSGNARNSRIKKIEMFVSAKTTLQYYLDQYTNFFIRVYYEPYWQHKINGFMLYQTSGVNGIPPEKIAKISGVE